MRNNNFKNQVTSLGAKRSESETTRALKEQEKLINDIDSDLFEVDIDKAMNCLKYAAINIQEDIDSLLEKNEIEEDASITINVSCLLEQIVSIMETIDLVRRIDGRVTTHLLRENFIKAEGGSPC